MFNGRLFEIKKSKTLGSGKTFIEFSLIPYNHNTRRDKSGKKYHELSTRTSSYHKSALPYLTRLLNNI